MPHWFNITFNYREAELAFEKALKDQEDLVKNVPKNIIAYGESLETFKSIARKKHPGCLIFGYYTQGDNFYYSYMNWETNETEYDICL